MDSTDSVEQRPYTTILHKMTAAQKGVSSVRLIVLLITTIGYIISIKKGTMPWLAYTLLVAGWLYALYMQFFKPYTKYTALVNGTLPYITDALLITLWVWATGGYYSTYFIIWYVSIAAVAYRRNASTTMLMAFLYTLCYGLLMLVTDKLDRNLPVILIRCSFIFTMGYLVYKVTHSNYLQTHEDATIKELMDGLQQTEQKLITTEKELYKLQTRFDELIAERTEEIREQSMFYKRLLDALPAMAWTADTNGRMTYINKLFEDFSPTELNKLIPEKYIEPADIARTKAAWQHAQHTGQPFTVQHRWINTAGDTVWMASHMVPVKSDMGIPAMWIGVAIDISEQRKELSEKDTYTGIIANEMKTPLTGIKEYAQLAKKALDSEETEGARIFISRTGTYISHAEQLINELVDTGKIQTGRMALHFSEFEITALTESIIEKERTNNPEKIIQFIRSQEDYIQADKERIEQVLHILLTNAIARTTKEVRLTMEVKKDVLQISVTDRGDEIPTEKREKIFCCFYKDGSRSGLRVDLFIARELTLLHNGDMWCESSIAGTTIYFTIPIRQPNKQA